MFAIQNLNNAILVDFKQSIVLDYSVCQSEYF